MSLSVLTLFTQRYHGRQSGSYSRYVVIAQVFLDLSLKSGSRQSPQKTNSPAIYSLALSGSATLSSVARSMNNSTCSPGPHQLSTTEK